MIEPTRVIAVRHGRTAWNAELRIQGHLDIPLDAFGVAQAQALARALAGSDVAAVYSSDLQRAMATAAPLAAALALDVRAEPGLRERAFGCFEGLRHDEIEHRWPHAWQRWRRRDVHFAPDGGGESLAVFQPRCVAAAAAIAARHPGTAIVLVVHGGVLDALYRAAVGVALDAPRTWSLGNAAIGRLLCADGRFTLVGWGDDAHLAALEAPPLPFVA